MGSRLVNFTDQRLLRMLQEGSREAFNMLYERYWPDAYSRAFKRLHDDDLAKDVVQEVFVSIWLNRARAIENLPAYLNTAVRNRVFKLAARQKVANSFSDFLTRFSGFSAQADSNLRSKELIQAYEALVSSLPPKRQLIFRLRFHEDKNTDVIASQMGITRKTVQNQLTKAIEQLRIVLLPSLILLVLMFF